MSVLILNSAYEPLQIVPMRRAIKLIFRGVAVVEKYSDSVWKTSSVDYQLPSVVRLLQFFRVINKNYKIGRKKIFLRDKNVCQYCQRVFGGKSLTIDHIIPKSRGGTSEWDNLVTSCLKCNHKKGDKLLSEWGVQNPPKPKRPTTFMYTLMLKTMGEHNPKWREFLYS